MNYSLCQWIILAIVLIPSIVTDIKERKICVSLLTAGIVAGVVYAVTSGPPRYSEFFFRFIPGILILLTAKLAKGCIGTGDGLVCIFLATIIKSEYLYSSIVGGFILAAVTGLIFIILRKMTGKSQLPFIPFLSAGVLICGFV